MKIIKASGARGWFTEATTWKDGTWDEPGIKFYTVWVDKMDDEIDMDHRLRCEQLGASMGLTVGRRQIGQRVTGDAPKEARKIWMVDDVPREWTDGMVKKAIESKFTGVEVTRRASRGRVTSWWFKGTTTRGEDMVAIDYVAEGENHDEDDEARHKLWARLAPDRVLGKQMRDIKYTTGFTFTPAIVKDLEVKTVNVWLKKDPEPQQQPPPTMDDSGSRAMDDVKMDEATDQKKEVEGEKDEEQPLPDGKRARGEQNVRVLPDGVTVNTIPGDGNCLFSAMGMGITKIRKDVGLKAVKTYTAKIMRAEAVAHRRSHKNAYRQLWDGNDSEGRDIKEKGFDAYLSNMAINGKWGGSMEIRALCRKFDVRVMIISARADSPNYVFHDEGKKGSIYMLYTGDHYDLLDGDTHKLLDIKGQTATGGLRGGALPWTKRSAEENEKKWKDDLALLKKRRIEEDEEGAQGLHQKGVGGSSDGLYHMCDEEVSQKVEDYDQAYIEECREGEMIHQEAMEHGCDDYDSTDWLDEMISLRGQSDLGHGFGRQCRHQPECRGPLYCPCTGAEEGWELGGVLRLVDGGYGHPREGCSLFGGARRRVLRQMGRLERRDEYRMSGEIHGQRRVRPPERSGSRCP